MFSPRSRLNPAPHFFRRSAAVFYDLLLLIAVLFAATALILPLNAGEAFTGRHIFYPFYLLTVAFGYYAWFWTHGGQTPGLKTWRLRVLTFAGEPLTWKHALFRFASAALSWACLGLGFAWMLFDKNRLGWHDYLSGTAVYFAGL